MGSTGPYDAIAKQLAAHVSGQVRFDDMMRVLYSTDASHYQVYPIGVVLPKTNEDIAAAVHICAEHGLPIVPRGGGSGLCGASIGPGVVIDPTKYMTRVLDVDTTQGTARVQAGAVLGIVNKQLAKLGWQFGPDPASAERAAIGGIIGTNATGAHSIRYGMTSDNLLALGCVLADGSAVELGAETTDDGRRTAGSSSVVCRLSSSITQIARTHEAAIRERFPKVWRRASGYNLDTLVEMLAFDPANPTACLTEGNALRQTFNLQNHLRQISQFNLAPLMAGSEGTLAVVAEATLNLVPKPKQTALVIVQFERLLDAMRAVPVLLQTDPDAIELVGDTFIKLARDLPEYRDKMHWLDLSRGVPEASLVMEFAGSEASEIAASVERAVALINNEHVPCTTRAITDPAAQADVWAVRKGGLAILQSIRSEFKPISVVEDVAVPVQHLADFVEELLAIFADFGANGAIYGHASAGCLHVRPLVNMKTVAGMATVHGIAERALALTLRYSGAMSGEHGDGYERTRHNAELFGDEVYQAFCDVKAAFDPKGLLNPNKKVHGLDLDESMRFGPGYKTFAFPSTFTFQKDGSLGALAERCNGQGVCRKQDSGVMCPSYRVTMDEEHNTRGRANLLQELLSNRGKWAEEGEGGRGNGIRPISHSPLPIPLPQITQADVMASLDLCLSCKACESECASGVDMAKMKSDFTQQVYAEQGVPMRAWALGRIAMLSGLASIAPAIANGFMKQRWFKRLIGIAEERELPAFARETFMGWWHHRRNGEWGMGRRSMPISHSPFPSRSVVLFVDTFTRYNHPEIGIAAVNVLEKLGYAVIVPEWQCCGRPLISQGQPKAARELAEFNISILAPLARQGLPILGLEPSCISALKDDYLDLVPGEDAKAVAKAVVSVEEFIISDLSSFMANRSNTAQVGRAQMKDERSKMTDDRSKILYHGHCHQKAVWSTKGSKQALTQSGCDVKEIESTCCGMAGAFGFEAEHDALSRQIGELALLPAVRAASDDTLIVAPGTSCRQQIEGLTGRRALHPIEVIAQRLAEASPTLAQRPAQP